MLGEATKIINSAFQGSFIKKLSLYLHDCVREEVKSSTFRNLNQDKDNKWMFLEGPEELLKNSSKSMSMDGDNNELTQLMVHSEISQKDRYLMYGYLFLTGSATKKKGGDFLTPLLYVPCKLERKGKKIECSMSEDTLSLNTGALASLMKYDDEDEAENLFEGLIDVVPDLPLTEEKLQIFLITLKSLVPDIEIDFSDQEPEEADIVQEMVNEVIEESAVEEELEEKVVLSNKVVLEDKSALILTKRPSVTAGVLHELTQISEKPSGVFRETAMNVINEEYMGAKPSVENKKKKDVFVPYTPLELSDSQTDVIKTIENNALVNVYGPPGTGKSQTIVNLVCHLVASGKTVLVASRMDKAVDVVSERLNSLGAPYLSLRAGRLNYQKQLNFQLQDLLSNKVDLDTGFESAILVNHEDMKNLVSLRKELSDKCTKIIKEEEKWYSALKEYQEKFGALGDDEIKINDLLPLEIESCKKILDKLDDLNVKSGFLNSALRKINQIIINKKLGLKKKYTPEEIDLLNRNIEVKELAQKLKSIEIGINKTGNLQQLLDNIRDTRKKQKTLAVDILRKQRRESLKGIMRDQLKRQRLIVHSKSLVERKKNLQNRLLEEEDFTPLLDAFPCWAVTTYSISESLPLKPGLFDVAIIDEASQCDIASCFPVLFRAKKAVVVGDDKQLPHLSFLDKAKEQSFLSQYDIPDKYQLMWRFRTNSMFDLANYYSINPVLLDEHFRSVPQIINYSNREFYGSRIRIMKKDRGAPDTIELNIVKDGKVDLDTTRNMAEVEKILEKLQEVILEDEKNNPDNPTSIGIISPFRGQVDLIKKALIQVLSENKIKKHQIEVGTAHTFQGDEKDVIFLSFALAPNSHFQSLTFVQKPNLFNVAITRARKKMYCYISREPESLHPGILRNYLEYIRSMNSQPVEYDEIYNNEIEQELASKCREQGIKVIPDYETAGFKINLMMSYEDKEIAVEVDGIEGENNDNSKKIWKQSILERCGWKVLRVTAREWHYSQKVCIDKIKRELNI